MTILAVSRAVSPSMMPFSDCHGFEPRKAGWQERRAEGRHRTAMQRPLRSPQARWQASVRLSGSVALPAGALRAGHRTFTAAGCASTAARLLEFVKTCGKGHRPAFAPNVIPIAALGKDARPPRSVA